MASLATMPQDCLEIIFHYLQPAEKGLARISRTCKQLFKAVECSTMAWAEVDGSRVLVSADDKELASVFVAPESTARELVALNLSGLDRLRGTVLCDLFRGPTLQNRTPAISDGLPEAPNPHAEKSGLRQALQLYGPLAIAEQAVLSPSKPWAAGGIPPPEKPTVNKPRLSSARFGRGVGGHGGQSDGDGSASMHIYPALSSGEVRAVKLRALDLSQCALLDPHALVAALGGCPVLEILNLNGSHACQNDWTLVHAVEALQSASSRHANRSAAAAASTTPPKETLGAAGFPQPPPPQPLPAPPPLHTLRLSRSLGVGAAVPTKVRRAAASSNSNSSSSSTSDGSGAGDSTNGAASAAAAAAARYSRDELGFEGLAACARGLPKLAVLALNNHVKLGDADLAPLFLGTSCRSNNDFRVDESVASMEGEIGSTSTSASTSGTISSGNNGSSSADNGGNGDDSQGISNGNDGATTNNNGIAPAVGLEVLELCACARVSSEMCALLLALLPLHELQANRCWRLDRTALACLNPLQLGDATNPDNAAAGADAGDADAIQEQEEEVLNQGGGAQAFGAPAEEVQGNGGLNLGGAIATGVGAAGAVGGNGADTAATATSSATSTATPTVAAAAAAAVVVHHSASTVNSFSVARNDAAMAHYQELAAFVHTQMLATESPPVAAGYANARALLVLEGNATSAGAAGAENVAPRAAAAASPPSPSSGPRVTPPAHQRLKVLSVSGCEKLTGNDIASAACACSNLKQLVVAKCALQDSDLERIAAAHAAKWMTSSSNSMTSLASASSSSSSSSSGNAAWVRSSGALAVHSSSLPPLLQPPLGLPFSGLEVVNLSKCSDVTTTGVRTLVSAVGATLQQLNLSDCPHVNCSFFFDLPIMAAAASNTSTDNSSSSSSYSSSSNDGTSVIGGTSGSHEVLGALHTLNLRNLPGVSDDLMTCLLSNRAAGGCGADRLKKLFLGMSAPQRRRQPQINASAGSTSADGVADAAAGLSLVDNPSTQVPSFAGQEKGEDIGEEKGHLLTDDGIKTIAAALGWGLECVDLENHTLIGDASMLDLFKKCPRLKRLLVPGIGMGSKPLRALAVGKRCPDLAELHVRPASRVKQQQQQQREEGQQDDDGDNDHDESEAAFDREWDAGLSALRRRRPDIAKKTLQAPGSQVKRCVGRFGAKLSPSSREL